MVYRLCHLGGDFSASCQTTMAGGCNALEISFFAGAIRCIDVPLVGVLVAENDDDFDAALIISLAPVIIVVLSRWILRTSITLKQTLGVAVSLVGACVVIVRGDLSVLRSVALNSGDLLMLVALPNWALYSVLLKRKPPKLDPRAMLVATLFIGLVMTIPFTLWEINNTQAIRWSISTAAGIAYLGVFAGALAYICWNRGVGEVGANRAGLFLHLIPLFAALFAVMFLGERIQGYHLVGAALIVFGIRLTNVESGLGKRGVTTAVTRATHR